MWNSTKLVLCYVKVQRQANDTCWRRLYVNYQLSSCKPPLVLRWHAHLSIISSEYVKILLTVNSDQNKCKATRCTILHKQYTHIYNISTWRHHFWFISPEIQYYSDNNSTFQMSQRKTVNPVQSYVGHFLCSFFFGGGGAQVRK